jgi:hypothetical protein
MTHSLLTIPDRGYLNIHLLSKLWRTHSKSSNDDFAKFKQCERVILNLG